MTGVQPRRARGFLACLNIRTVCVANGSSYLRTSAGGAERVSPGRKPWEGKRIEPSPVGATQIGRTILPTFSCFQDTVFCRPCRGLSCICPAFPALTGWANSFRASGAAPNRAETWRLPLARGVRFGQAQSCYKASQPPSRGPVAERAP